MGSGLASWRQCHLLRLPEEGAEPGEAGVEGPGPRRQLRDWSQCRGRRLTWTHYFLQVGLPPAPQAVNFLRARPLCLLRPLALDRCSAELCRTRPEAQPPAGVSPTLPRGPRGQGFKPILALRQPHTLPAFPTHPPARSVPATPDVQAFFQP